MTAATKPLTQITSEAIRLLCKEMGVVNALRFVNQFTTGYGEYTKERRHLFADMAVEDIASHIRRKKAARHRR
jgi:hypothetical protein